MISDVIALFQEPRHGMNRVAFVQALAKSNVGNARLALENGRNDPDVGAEIHRVLDRRKRRR